MKHINKNPLLNLSNPLALLLLLLGSASDIYAADADLLDALKSEAAVTSVEKDKPVKKSPPTPTPGTAPKKKNSYLDGLSSEAASTQVDDSSAISTRELKTTSKKNKKEEHWDIDTQNLGTMRPGLDLNQFESILKDNYFASYIFYKKLDPTSQNLVFKSYQHDPEIEHIRNKIISLSR